MAKPKIPLEEALQKGIHIKTLLQPYCLRIEIAGSIRRKKPTVGDIEILYIPKPGFTLVEGDLMETEVEDLCQEFIKTLFKTKTLELRKKSNNSTAFGKLVKLLTIPQCQTPIDLFRCKQTTWANNLLSRTGGKTNNIRIASSALKLGIEWMPFGPGFFNPQTQKIIPISCEEEAYQIVNLPFQPPENRM